jgi:predicted small lipoprotein YifL
MKKIFAYLLFVAVVMNIAGCDKGGGFLLPASS